MKNFLTCMLVLSLTAALSQTKTLDIGLVKKSKLSEMKSFRELLTGIPENAESVTYQCTGKVKGKVTFHQGSGLDLTHTEKEFLIHSTDAVYVDIKYTEPGKAADKPITRSYKFRVVD